ncbi:hypothetical protein [Kitasatospora sp. NPDC050463]|uniref:hypothetical protein n=1 Tax=Kitasatospora sp. NPDC050463 TaxID=3155786 RepID=UPI0033D697C9
MLPVGELPGQGAHQVVDGGRRVGAERPRFGGGFGEDVLVQALGRLASRGGRRLEGVQQGVQLGVECGG